MAAPPSTAQWCTFLEKEVRESCAKYCNSQRRFSRTSCTRNIYHCTKCHSKVCFQGFIWLPHLQLLHNARRDGRNWKCANHRNLGNELSRDPVEGRSPLKMASFYLSSFDPGLSTRQRMSSSRTPSGPLSSSGPLSPTSRTTMRRKSWTTK